MGQCAGGCAAGSPKLPSAVQLCDAVEYQLRNMREQRAATLYVNGDPAAALQIAALEEGVWHYLEREEVRAVGIIVERWSKGKIDGTAARQQFQAQVLRGLTQQTVELQNASSAFLRAGLDGALAGIVMGGINASASSRGGPIGGDDTSLSEGSAAATNQPGSAAATSERPTSTPISGPSSTGPSSSGPSGASTQDAQDAANAAPNAAAVGSQEAAAQQAGFNALARGIFGGLAAAVLGGAQAGRRTQNVFTAIEVIFLHSTYEESFNMAMRELGIDGPRPVPDEVRNSFKQKARNILEAAPRQQASSASWLDLVMLCLCAEVVRHLKDPERRNAVTRNSPPATSAGETALFAGSSGAASSSQHTFPPSTLGPRQGHLVITSAGMGQPEFVLGLGWPQSMAHIEEHESHGQMITMSSQNRTISMTAGHAMGDNSANGFRLDPDFLRDRVFVLLESLLTGGLVAQGGRPAGLTLEEMDTHCPVVERASVDDDSCPICLERSVVGEAVRRLPCNHQFHRECCEAWLATADTCPTCRFKIERG